MTALNFLVTIITMRAPGMSFWRMPLLVWANFTTSLLVVIATPFIAGSQFFVMFDHVMHTDFFNYTPAATRSATSTSSGSTPTRRSTS
jgi:cytochrome c oxidase subunit 1